MADMIFDGNQLKWGNDSWPATSGPYGNGAAQRGLYSVERRHVAPLTSNMKTGFLDPATKLGFFVPITPAQGGRTGLGIHPDGGTPGTEGCIGIKSDAIGFYNKLSQTGIHAVLTLEVR